MIKYVILISTLTCLAYSQRPAYAGSAGRYPVVLPQYTQPPPASAVGNPIVGNPNGGDAFVGNRIDSQNGEAGITSVVKPAFAPVTTTAAPLDLPLEAYGDADLVNRIKMWPRDKQPFWFINQQQINAHRGSVNMPGTATQPPQTLDRSFFAG